MRRRSERASEKRPACECERMCHQVRGSARGSGAWLVGFVNREGEWRRDADAKFGDPSW